MKGSFDWDWAKGYVDPNKFWNLKEIKSLPYTREEFNDSLQVLAWETQGQQPRVGAMYDMRHDHQPFTTAALTSWAENRGLEHVGISYYKMCPGDNLPWHWDTYKRYIQLFDLSARREHIYRYIFFVEPRLPGHVMEVAGRMIDWIDGDYIAWRYDTPHVAGNLGHFDRYTIQLTGVKREDI